MHAVSSRKVQLKLARCWPLAAIIVLVSCGSGASGRYTIPGLSAVAPESPLVRSARNDSLTLPDARGPAGESPRPQEIKADWREYGSGEPSRLAILLTKSDSAWLGLAHGMKSFGIPFMITDALEKALEHRVVLVYPG